MSATLAFAEELAEVAQQIATLQSKAQSALEQPTLASELSGAVLEEYRRLSMAAAMSDMPAVQAVADWIIGFTQEFHHSFVDANIELLLSGQFHQWLTSSVAVLKHPEDTSHLATLHQTLVDSLWPSRINEQQLSDLLLSFRTAHLNESAPNKDNETLELRWEETIHPDLLEAYLQETPLHVEQASELIQSIANQSANATQKQQAVRLVHTIKGASAVVGIKPIVQLTHQLEDILDYPMDTVLPDGLAEVLSTAADHLSLLFERLVKQQTLPDQFPALMQQLNDWQQRLHKTQPKETSIVEQPAEHVLVPDFITLGQLAPETPETTASETLSALQQELEPHTSHIQVPTDTLQQLLNLVGESITCNTQLQAQLQTSAQYLKQVQQHEERIQFLFDELEDAIEQKNTINNTNKHSMEIKPSHDNEVELEQYHSLYGTYGLLAEAITDTRELTRQLRQATREMNEQTQRQKYLQHELSDHILHTRMLPISTILPRIQRTVRETCRNTGKQASITLEGAEHLLDHDVLQALTAPLLHMIRNAIDHGIETPARRIALSKPSEGQLQLQFSQQHGRIHMTLSDDGAGFDTKAIRAKALQYGLINEQHQLTQADILRLILQPGFSTRSTVNETSGRGIGMDVVHHAINQLRGQIHLATQAGQGSRIHIDLPLKLVTTQALIVRAGEHWLALPTHDEQQIITINAEQSKEQDGHWVVQYHEQTLPVYPLSALLNWPLTPIDLNQSFTLLLIQTGDKQCFIQLDEATEPQDIVVKSLEQWQDLSVYVHGASLLPDGRVIPVLDLISLLQRQDTQQLNRIQQQWDRTTNTAQTPQKILIVDDSLSNRKAVFQMVEQMQYIPLTARDGFNGLEQLQAQAIDLIITDLEMPRMNGLEMTQAVRQWEDKKHIPVIMLTSRSTHQHRQLAQQAGINTYLTKPVSYATLSSSIQHLLTNTTPID